MAATSFSIFSLLFALLSGGATDLLDLVPSDGYWKAKNVVAVTVDQLVTEITPQAGANIADLIKALGSGNPTERDGAASKIRAMGPAAVPALEKAADDPDPEVANRVRGLSEQIKLNSKAAGVRKLMAIRTLGEMKKPEALPALRALVNSKEMFVADYATRAIAQIEGKPLPARGAPAAQLKADLTLLPAKCGVVGQFSFASTKPISIEQVAKQVPVMPGEDRRQSLEMLTGHVIAIADQIGNVRIEGVTFGVADDVGPNGGFAAVIVRGQWDARAVQNFVRPLAGANSVTIENVEVLTPNKAIALALHSDQRLLAFAGPSRDKMPIKDLIVAAGNDKGPLLTDNPDLARLIASIDTTAPVWAVCKVSPAYRAAPVVQAFDTLTLVTRQDRDGLKLELAGVGSDAGAVKDAVNVVNRELATVKMEIPKAAQQVPPLKPLSDFVQTIDCQADGKSARLTGSYRGDPASFLGLPFWFVAGSAPQPVPAPPAAAQPPVQQPQPGGNK